MSAPILRALGGFPRTVEEVARAAGMSEGEAARLLRALESRAWVYQTGGGWSLREWLRGRV